MGVHKRFDTKDEEIVTKPAKQEPQQARPHLKVAAPRSAGPVGISKPGKSSWGNKGMKKRGGRKPIKGAIRSIERLLRNKGAELPPSVKAEKEAELKELLRLKEEHGRRDLETRMAKKYRMVKFFEKRKLQRTLDKIMENGDKPEDAEQKKQILKDLRYIEEYPKDKKYIALFPSGGHCEESRKRVEEMRSIIENNMHTPTAEQAAHKPVAEHSKGEDGTHRQDDFFLNVESD